MLQLRAETPTSDPSSPRPFQPEERVASSLILVWKFDDD